MAEPMSSSAKRAAQNPAQDATKDAAEGTAKSVLLTNLYLSARTGSELHILELARQFKKEGWDVTCYTLVYSYPLQAYFEQEGIKVVTYGNEAQLADHYSLLYAQHRVVSEHVYSLPQIHFDRVVVSVLGVVTKHEELPYFYKDSDAIIFISEEARQHHLKNCDYTGQVLVLPNSVPQEFFSAAPPMSKVAPQKIGVISNHPPQELFELEAASKGRLDVDIWGTETQSVSITPELLSAYDVIVSIGRTASCALALGVPFYCYDMFGGPGYILPNNAEEHLEKNFSGRSKPTKLNAEQLFEDISSGYARALAGRDELQTFAQERLSFESYFQRLHAVIDAAFEHEKSEPQTNSRLEPAIVADEIHQMLAAQQALLGHAQLFYAPEGQSNFEPCEEYSKWIDYRYDSEIALDLKAIIGQNAKVMRFDPDIRPCVSRVLEGKVLGKNSYMGLGDATPAQLGSLDIFFTDDPMYFLEPCQSLSFYGRKSNGSDMQAIIEGLLEKNAATEARAASAEQELQATKASRAYKLAKKAGNLYRKFAG